MGQEPWFQYYMAEPDVNIGQTDRAMGLPGYTTLGTPTRPTCTRVMLPLPTSAT